MTSIKSPYDASEHPTHRGKDEPLSLTEQSVFGADAVRDPLSGRVFEQGSGAHPRHIQSAMFKRQAEIEEALRQAEAAAAAEQKPALRLVRAT